MILHGHYLWGAMLPKMDFFEKLAQLEGYLTVYEAIRLYEIAYLTAPKPIAEIGSFKGRSTFCLAQGVKDKIKERQWTTAEDSPFRTKAKLYSIDIAHDPLFEANMLNTGVQDIIHICKGKSVNFGKAWQGGSEYPALGAVFIDGNHDYGEVREDFAAWLPNLEGGDIIALHDAGGFWAGPTKVAMEQIIGNPRFTDVRQVDSLIHARLKGGES